jgi:hypothetical protein
MRSAVLLNARERKIQEQVSITVLLERSFRSRTFSVLCRAGEHLLGYIVAAILSFPATGSVLRSVWRKILSEVDLRLSAGSSKAWPSSGRSGGPVGRS